MYMYFKLTNAHIKNIDPETCNGTILCTCTFMHIKIQELMSCGKGFLDYLEQSS